jgi:hypothetical protein
LLIKAPPMKGINSIRRPRLPLLSHRLPYDLMITFHPVKRTFFAFLRIARVTVHVPALFFTLLFIPQICCRSWRSFSRLYSTAFPATASRCSLTTLLSRISIPGGVPIVIPECRNVRLPPELSHLATTVYFRILLPVVPFLAVEL